MRIRTWLVPVVSIGLAATIVSCSPAGTDALPDRVERSVTFQIDREASAGASSRQSWTFVSGAFLSAPPVEGVTLACDNFHQRFSGEDEARQVRDSGYVWIHNDTGKTMYDTVATIEDVGADTDGTVWVTFGQTRFEYGDIPVGGGDRGPDSSAVDGDEQEWYYQGSATDIPDAYLDTLKFTVKVSWLADP